MNLILYSVLLLMLIAIPLLIVFDGRNVKKGHACTVAKKIFDMHVALFEGERYEYREVSLASFPDVDVGFYDATARELETQGFYLLGDIENTSVAKATNLHSLMRVMIDQTHSTVVLFADVYNPKRNHHRKLIDFTTEFADNRFLETSNADEQGYITPPQVQVHRVPGEVSAKALFIIHRNRLAEHHSQYPEVTTKTFNSIQDVIEGWGRSRILRLNHRKTLTTEQLRQEFEQLTVLKKQGLVFIAAAAKEYEKLYKQYRAMN